MDSKNFTIGILSTTAVILLVGLVIVGSRPSPAAAEMTVARGDYIVTIGNSPQVDEEFIYVVDVPEQKMIVYRFDTPRKQLAVVHGIDLADVREKSSSQQRRP